ncbi:MAG: tetratricopeptide repeat protein [Chloroflexi bacterium]|nr:tetratricopeptide repeat protein [Chloroflexota bacterium]
MIAQTVRSHRPRPIGILATALLLTAGTVLAGWSGLADRTASPAPGDAASLSNPAPGEVQPGPVSVPIPGAGTAELPAGSLAQLDHNIAAWTSNLEANPLDFISATNLATLYHGRARLTADLADHERALEAARTAIAIAPTQAGARLLEASILFSLHDFPGALAAADALYREDPTQLGALATRADAALELGDLEAARRDLASLAAATSGPAVDIRLARLAAVTGDLDGALDLARRARDVAVAEGTDPGFYAYAVGEYARLAGDATTARAGFEAALEVRAGDLGALLGLARIQAFEGDLDAAMATLESAVAIAPTPEAEALLGDLLAARAAAVNASATERAADARAAATAHGTVRLSRDLSALAGSVYDRQLVLFELDHAPTLGTAGPAAAGGGPGEANLEAARAALAVRPDAAGHDLVGWALHRLGRDAEALIESAAARSTGAADARTLFHAGAIAAALGDDAAARDLLTRALALGPALDPIERAEAAAVLAALDPATMTMG